MNFYSLKLLLKYSKEKLVQQFFTVIERNLFFSEFIEVGKNRKTN